MQGGAQMGAEGLSPLTLTTDPRSGTRETAKSPLKGKQNPTKRKK